MRLTLKQEAFALAYIKLQNSSAAYRAGYNTSSMKPKTVHEAASRLLKNSKVAARIAELKAPAILAAGLSLERTLREIACVVYADPRRFYRADGTLKDPVEWDDDMAAAVAQVEIDEPTDQLSTDGSTTTVRRKRPTKLKFWNKIDAIDQAMRHLGLFGKDNRQLAQNLAIQVNLVEAPRKATGAADVRGSRRDR
jgi:phage terminase small subunit